MKSFDFTGKNVLIRVDFNVPQNDQLEVTDNTRMRAAMPTIKQVLNEGGKPVLMSHLGRPDGRPSDEFSLKHLVAELEQLSGVSVSFAPECVGEVAKATVNEAPFGSIVLLENLRFHKEETAGDETFAQQLAELGDIYLNDAFGTAHRAHASTAIVAQFFSEENKGFGQLMDDEVSNISKALGAEKSTAVAIVGGAKVSSKIGVIENMIDKVGTVIIGGGMAFTFIKAQGGAVGTSLIEDDKLDLANELLKMAADKGCRLVLPTDTQITREFKDQAPESQCDIFNIPDGYMGLDMGLTSQKMVSDIVKEAKTIIWNGPMGVFEFEHYSGGTKAIADAVAEATANGAFSLVGGGDSVAAINQFGYTDKVSYISTGGGAMLEFLEGRDLPGVAALK